VICSIPVITIAQGWPCWLTTILAFGPPLEAAFVAPSYQHFFVPITADAQNLPWRDLSELHNLSHWPVVWDNAAVLVLGSLDFLNLVMAKLNGHVGVFIHAMEIVFTGHQMRFMEGLYERQGQEAWATLGLSSVTVAHADFGGITSACHLIL
jgi:hypothetical protein